MYGEGKLDTHLKASNVATFMRSLRSSGRAIFFSILLFDLVEKLMRVFKRESCKEHVSLVVSNQMIIL